MYCKRCGHRGEGTAQSCPRCGAQLTTVFVPEAAGKRPFRWQVPAVALLAAIIVFAVFPRVFMRSELEPIGPTNKVRFLRALSRSEYRRAGQLEFRVDGQTLMMIWDLRWTVLPEARQKEIIRIVGRAWQAAGGEDTRFRIDGADDILGSFSKGEVHVPAQNPE